MSDRFVRCYIGDQPRPGVAEVESVDKRFAADWLEPGNWVSVRVEGMRFLIDRESLREPAPTLERVSPLP